MLARFRWGRYVRLLFASVSFPLRDASRPRVNFRLWTLCLLFPFTQFCAEPNLGKQLRCHHMFIYVWMSMPHLSCLHVEPCMLEFYISRTKRWVGGLIAHFLPCCFHFPPHSFHALVPTLGGDLWDNETQCSEFFVCEWMQFNDVAMQQQPHHAEPEIFPLSAQDGKVCARSFISAAHSVWTCRSKICK